MPAKQGVKLDVKLDVMLAYPDFPAEVTAAELDVAAADGEAAVAAVAQEPSAQQALPVVALVTDSVYPYFRGGVESRYHELSARLAKQAQVHIFTMKWWDGPAVRVEGDITFHAVSRLYPMYVGERRSYREALMFALACLRLLWFRFDVIEAGQIPNFHIITLRLVTWIKRKPLTVTWHEVWGYDYWHQYLGKKARIAWFIERLTMRLPDHLIAASEQTAQRLRAQLGEGASIAVVPNGIDLDGIRESYPGAAKVDLTTVGRLLPHKNVSVLLDALALLHADGTPATLRVVGDGPMRESLRAQARRLGIEDSVEFRHEVWEMKEVYSLMKAARIGVFPSTREGFGIAVLEALACGIPVVTTSAPDNLARHLVERAARGTVCAPTALDIARTLRDLLAQADDCRGDLPAVHEDWITAEHGWDAASDRVANALGLTKLFRYGFVSVDQAHGFQCLVGYRMPANRRSVIVSGQ